MDPGFYKHNREPHPGKNTNFLSILTYWWLKDLFFKGYSKQLEVEDIYNVIDKYKSSTVGEKYAALWKQTEDDGRPSLVRVIWRAHGIKLIIINTFYAAIEVSLRIAQPLFLGGLISYFSPGQTEITKNEAYYYATGVVMSMFINVLIVYPFLLYLYHTAMKIRVACCSLIYRKVMRLDLKAPSSDGDGLTGKVINLLTNDANRFDMAVLFFMEMIRAPIEGLIVIFILYSYIGSAALIGVAFLLCFIPLQAYLGHVTASLHRRSALKTDNRIRLMNEIIQGIQVIKMYAWENCFAVIIANARKKEMNIIKKMSWIKAISVCCLKLNTRISIFISIIAYILFGNKIKASNIFVLFSLYDLIKLTVVEFFPMSIMFVLDCAVSIKRIQDFLILPELNNNKGVSCNLKKNQFEMNIRINKLDKYNIVEEKNSGEIFLENVMNEIKAKSDPSMGLTMKNVSSTWTSRDTDGNEKIIVALENITLKVAPGEMVAIIGQVGCGKSTLLHAILGELHLTENSHIESGPISYCSQTPWLFEASVRQNILFGLEMDNLRYKRVIKACQLEDDFKMLPHKDKTIVGERGASLSGGQRARVSLARCVYRKASVYLLDDPLSAVDARVAKALYASCIHGVLKNSAVILATHQIHLLTRDARVCLLQSGKSVFQGTFAELQSSGSQFSDLLPTETENEAEKDKETKSPDEEAIGRKASRQRICSTSSASSLNSNDNAENVIVDSEAQAAGSVSARVYAAYVNSGGSLLTIFILLSLFIMGQVMFSLSDLWISEWVNLEEMSHYANEVKLIENNFLNDSAFNNSIISKENDWETPLEGEKNYWELSREQCVYIYSALIAITIFVTVNKLVMFFNICINASIKLHDTMFRGITRASMFFFNTNASGRILNRFSRDIGIIDIMLPSALEDCLGFLLEIIGILVVLCILNIWLLIPTSVVVIFLVIIRAIYIASARSLKRLEGISRSPAFTHVNATLTGLETVRSCHAQDQLCMEFDRHQDLHSSVWELVLQTDRAFGFWMDLVCWLYEVIVTFSFLVFSGDDTLGGKVGLAITQVMALVGMCQWGMRQTAEVENQMTSVERVTEYSNLPSEPPLEIDEEKIKEKYPKFKGSLWPQNGNLEMKNLYLRYNSNEDNYVLKNINFIVNDGEKIGIVGRTGAGKSSIIAALFRLTETEGSIIIDEVDTGILGLHQLRSAMSIIPQEPMLFSGSLRDNLDPWQKYTDIQLWDALAEVELKSAVMELSGGLNTKISDGGGNLSAGQRQLLCLARAILKQGHILLLDEATANVDPETDNLIQKTIRKKFADRTVLTIAHRLHTVMDSDKVLVMDKGNVVEFGHPFELLNKKLPEHLAEKLNNSNTDDSDIDEKEIEDMFNESTSGEGMFRALVQQTGPKTCEMLYKIAETSYKLKHETKKEN